MQNSLLCYTTTGNGSRCFSSVYHCKTIDFTICFAVHTRNHLPTLYNMCVNIDVDSLKATSMSHHFDSLERSVNKNFR